MKKWAPLLLVVIAAVAVIFYRFDQIPIHIAPDEIAFVRLALHLNKQAYTMYSPLETGHSTLYFYIILLSFKLFGVTLFALRLPAAVSGVLSAIVLYFIYQKVWSEQKINNIAMISMLIFITSRWYITFARFSFEATFLLLLELISLLSMLLFVQTNRVRYIIISSIFAGLAFHSYIPGRIFFLLPLIVILLYKGDMSNKYRMFKANEHHALVLGFAIPFLLIIFPLILQIVKIGDSRVATELTTSVASVGQNVVANIAMLFINGDMNGRHNYPGKPALNPILGFLFLIGLIPFFLKKKKSAHDHVFFMYLLISFIPTLLTDPKGNPNMLRTFTMLPSIVYFIGKGILSIVNVIPDLIGDLNKKQIPTFVRMTKLIIIFLILLSSLYELRTYFIFQKEVSFYAFEVKKPFEWVKANDFKLVEDWYRE